MSVTKNALIAAALFASFGGVSTAAIAGEVTLNEQGQRVVTVAYSDLNLNSSAGMKALEARISSAAKKACGQSHGRISLKEASNVRSCINGTRDSALAAVSTGEPVRVAMQTR